MPRITRKEARASLDLYRPPALHGERRSAITPEMKAERYYRTYGTEALAALDLCDTDLEARHDATRSEMLRRRLRA